MEIEYITTKILFDKYSTLDDQSNEHLIKKSN